MKPICRGAGGGVCRQGPNTINGGAIPIIFVPGVMGSRLRLPSGKYWDPDKPGRMLSWLVRGATTKRDWLNQEQVADVISDDDDCDEFLGPSERGKGWPGVAWGFYGDFLRTAHGLGYDQNMPVYAIGYDWRRSNASSGPYIAKKIGEVLKDAKAERFVLISHSMGGLASRSALLKAPDLQAKALGVLHVFQPATGAVVFYRRLWTGCRSELDGGFKLSMVMGRSPTDFATVVSMTRGPMELMPTDTYKYPGGPWLASGYWDATERKFHGTGWTGDVCDLYNSPSRPPGVTQQQSPPTGLREALAARFAEARQFHQGFLKNYMLQGKTWSVYSDGLETDHGTYFDTRRNPDYPYLRVGNYLWVDEILAYRPPEGDGTVPGPSGAALFPGVAFDTSEPVDERHRQFRVSGVDHSAAMNDECVRDVISKFISFVT